MRYNERMRGQSVVLVQSTWSGADPGFFKGGLEAMVIYKLYYIYCNYSHYYFKRSALYPTESYRCMNLLAAVPAA